MMADIGTVLWKEWREILSWGGSRGKAGVLIFIGVFGILMPLEMGPAWVESPALLAYWAWVPMLLVISVIADTFAGERERHTLETLLASRLPDRAILLGKVAAAVGYGAGVTWLSLLLGLVTVNLAVRHGGMLLYSPTVALEILGLSLTSAMLAASGGALVSLRRHGAAGPTDTEYRADGAGLHAGFRQPGVAEGVEGAHVCRVDGNGYHAPGRPRRGDSRRSRRGTTHRRHGQVPANRADPRLVTQATSGKVAP